jgi:hypothetical protein
MPSPPRLLAALLVAAAIVSARPAAAGTEQDKAQARQLGIDGVAAFERGDWSAALARFEAAERLFHAPTHLLFIARSQAELGQLVAARATYLRLEQETLAPGASPAFRKAQTDAAQERAALEEKIPVLVVRTEPAGVEGVEVLIDGHPVAASELPEAHVDPGRHRVEGRADGREAPPVEVEVAVGERRDVVLELPAPKGGDPGVTSPTAVTPATDDGAGTSTTTIAGLGAIGLGVAGLGVGAVLGVVSLGKSGDADDLYERCGGDAGCDASSPDGREVRALDDDAATLGTIGVVALGAGAAIAAAGVVLVIVGEGDDEGAPTDARVELVPTPAGALLRGAF